MPKGKKNLCVDSLRHAEYYDMQSTFDNLYQKSKREKFLLISWNLYLIGKISY